MSAVKADSAGGTPAVQDAAETAAVRGVVGYKRRDGGGTECRRDACGTKRRRYVMQWGRLRYFMQLIFEISPKHAILSKKGFCCLHYLVYSFSMML